MNACVALLHGTPSPTRIAVATPPWIAMPVSPSLQCLCRPGPQSLRRPGLQSLCHLTRQGRVGGHRNGHDVGRPRHCRCDACRGCSRRRCCLASKRCTQATTAVRPGRKGFQGTEQCDSHYRKPSRHIRSRNETCEKGGFVALRLQYDTTPQMASAPFSKNAGCSRNDSGRHD